MSTTTFRSAVVRTPGGPDSIEIVDVPLREPGPGQVRVTITAAAVNPVDLGVADGFFHARGLVQQAEHTGLGWDFAGTVDAVGLGVDGPAVGARVAGLIDGFDRDFGTYAERLVVTASDVAVVPDSVDLIAAATVPLNGLAARQVLDLLGSPPADRPRLLVTGAAGALGGYLLALAPERGWAVTGLARPQDADFVRGLGAAFTDRAEPGWDAVADAAVLHEHALRLVRDGGTLVGVRPGAEPAPERGITVHAVVTRPDGRRLADLLAKVAEGSLVPRIATRLPLERAGDAQRLAARSGMRGRVVLLPGGS